MNQAQPVQSIGNSFNQHRLSGEVSSNHIHVTAEELGEFSIALDGSSLSDQVINILEMMLLEVVELSSSVDDIEKQRFLWLGGAVRLIKDAYAIQDVTIWPRLRHRLFDSEAIMSDIQRQNSLRYILLVIEQFCAANQGDETVRSSVVNIPGLSNAHAFARMDFSVASIDEAYESEFLSESSLLDDEVYKLQS